MCCLVFNFETLGAVLSNNPRVPRRAKVVINVCRVWSHPPARLSKDPQALKCVPLQNDPLSSARCAGGFDGILLLPRIGSQTIRLTHLAAARLWQACKTPLLVTFSAEKVAVLSAVRRPPFRLVTAVSL